MFEFHRKGNEAGNVALSFGDVYRVITTPTPFFNDIMAINMVFFLPFTPAGNGQGPCTLF